MRSTCSPSGFALLFLIVGGSVLVHVRAFIPHLSASSSSLTTRLLEAVQEVESVAVSNNWTSVDPSGSDVLGPSTTGTTSTTSSKEALKENEFLPSPGFDENAKFKCDESVKFWNEFQSDGFWSAQSNIREIGEIGSRFARRGPQGLNYWLRHMGRSAYFATNAVLGNLSFMAHERLVNNKETTFTGALPFNMNSDVASRLVLEACLCYEQDYERIENGEYLYPWDMTSGHRQSSPLNVATSTGRFINEAIGTLGRRGREEKDIWISNERAPSLYPDYYKTAFHYQTDGWMSRASADVYETSTETLFLGRQDAMQRTSLPALMKQAERLAGQRPMQVLEVAAGTGRFGMFVRDNLPLDTEYTAVDLSPYYLDAVRDNDAYWRKTRREKENRNGGDISKSYIKPVKAIQSQAERLPFEDESFDAVLCVYLYHELPREVRAEVSNEMARVLKADGTLVLTDSIQRGDRPSLDSGLFNFEKMNEPFYIDYCLDCLPSHFEKAGLQPMTKTVRSTTKSLSFMKPVCDGVGECEAT